MVIKRSPGGQACRWRAVNFEIDLWSSGAGKNADCIFGDRSASSMSKKRPASAWTLTPEMIPFGTKSVTLSMFIDLLAGTMSCRSTQVKIASTDLWPQEMFTFSEMLALVESESSFGVSVPTSVRGGLGAPERLAILCVYVCVCVIVVIWAEPADVGLWVAVCFLAKISFHRPTCKTTFASLTQSQAISQSFRVFISFRSVRDTTFFHFSKLFFIQNYRFLYHGDQKNSWWTSKLQMAGSQLRNPPVKFRHERWLHLAIDLHPACPNRGRLELWPRKWFLLG